MIPFLCKEEKSVVLRINGTEKRMKKKEVDDKIISVGNVHIKRSEIVVSQQNNGNELSPFLYEIPLIGFNKHQKRVLNIFKELIQQKNQISLSQTPFLFETFNIIQNVYLCRKDNNCFISTNFSDSNELFLLLECYGCRYEEFTFIFEKEINYDLTQYYSCDLARLSHEYFTLLINSNIPFFFKYPILFVPQSILLKKDFASPIKQLSLSPLAFIFPLIDNITLLDRYLPSQFNYSYSNITERVISYSFGELLSQLISTYPKRKDEQLNELLLQTSTKLKDMKMPFLCYLNEPFFQKCYSHKDIIPVSLKSMGIQWEIESQGEGAVGTVFRSLCGKYAIKQCKPTFLSSTLREVRVLKLLNHPNLLKFVAYENNVIVTEWCDGGSLECFIKNKHFQRGIMPTNYFFHFTLQFNDGMDYLLHEVQLVHRDIKHMNILITTKPNSNEMEPFNLLLKIGDFNTSREISDVMKTKIGTECFMAKEVREGGSYSVKAEIVSIGIFLYYLLSGTTPKIKSKNDSDTIYDITFFETTRLINPPLYDEMYELISSMVRSDPKIRIGWEEYINHFSSIHKKFA